VLGLEQPTVGLLNVGSEDQKGHESIRDAAARLRVIDLALRFHGFVEGNDIATGTVDVVVTDGFTGNVALKTAEGTAKLYSELLRRTFQSSILARIGYLLARPAFKKLKARTDPRRYNGAVFLGLRGICVKSHGGTDAFGFANAIGVAHDLAAQGFNERIKEEMPRVGAVPASGIEAAAG
jgi:glycerol-3-phosphate acyltransferase PlsX